MKATELFEAKKKAGKPVLSFEIFPPKKEEALKNIDATLARLCDLHPDLGQAGAQLITRRWSWQKRSRIDMEGNRSFI